MQVKEFCSYILSFILLTVVLVSSAQAGSIKGQIKVKGARDARDAIVYIEKAEGEFKAPTEHARMDQKGMAFLPHVLPVLAGTAVDFLNSDEVMHNVFTPDKCAEKFNLGSWPQGEIRSYTFDKTSCVSVVLCNVHPEMEAWVVVLQNPYFYKTDKTGAFVIENVPAGKYTLKIWHKKLKSKPQAIEVPAESDVTVDFLLKR